MRFRQGAAFLTFLTFLSSKRLRGCFGFAEASLLGMTQETEDACLKPSLPILRMLVPMLCVGTHSRNALRSKTPTFGRRAPWLAFTSSVAGACPGLRSGGSCPRRTVGTRKQNPKQPLCFRAEEPNRSPIPSIWDASTRRLHDPLVLHSHLALALYRCP